MKNRNNSESFDEFSFFQTSRPRTACTRLQLILVLTSFVSSLGVALVLVEKPFQNKTRAKNNRVSAAWQLVNDEASQNRAQ